MKIIFAAILTFILSFLYIIKGNTNIDSQEKARRLGKKIAIIVAVIFIPTYYMLVFISSIYYNQQEFDLNNSNKYIIYQNEIDQEGKLLYYEIDFSKETIVYREDNKDKMRKYKGTILKEYNNSIKRILDNVISNEDNLTEISQDEKQNYYREKIYNFYSIKTHNNKLYYIKDKEQIKELSTLLQHYRNRIY